MLEKAKILVVEDEQITAMAITETLKDLGFKVVGHANCSDAAVSLAEKKDPDLILMDIKLDGKIDGIKTAEIIKKNYNIPVIFLTAYSDQSTLNRAKITEPFSYLLKPLNERELLASIQIAIFHHHAEMKIKANEQWLSTTLNSIGDAVISTNAKGEIEFLNPIAENLIGWKKDRASHKKIENVIKLTHPEKGKLIQNPVLEVIKKSKKIFLEKNIFLINQKNKSIPVEINTAPILDSNENVIGAVQIIRDISERISAEQHREKLIKERKEALDTVKKLEGLLPICSWCKKIYDEEGNWTQLEQYIHSHSRATFTHGMCPECSKKVMKKEGLD